MLVERSSSVRRWNLSLEKTVCVLNFIARKVACCSAMYVYLAHEVVSAKFDTRPRREAISLQVKLLRLVCHVWRSMCSSAVRLSSGMPMVSLRVLMRMLSCLRTYEHSLSLHLVMDKGLIRNLVSGSPRRMSSAFALVAMAGRKCGQTSASKLSSTNIAFFVGPRVPFEKTPGLMLSLVAGTRSCGQLFKSLVILTRSRRALCF